MITINPPAFDRFVFYGISGLAAAISIAWLVQCLRSDRAKFAQMFAGVASLWALSFGGSYFGWFQHLDILPPPAVLAGGFAFTLVWLAGTGSIGDALVKTMPYKKLVALQVFRLPLELLMLRAASLAIMPVEFSMRGYNLDVLTGLSALFIWMWLAMKSPQWIMLRVIRIWNAFGILCLTVIGALAVLTSPLVAAFGAAPLHVNTWILYFPYTLLPLVLLSAAIFGHIILTRKLALENATQPHFLKAT